MTASEMLELKDKYPDKFRVLEDRLYETDRDTIITRLITSVVLMGLNKDIVPDYRLIEMYIIALPVEKLEDILKEIGKDIDESRLEEIANGKSKE